MSSHMMDEEMDVKLAKIRELKEFIYDCLADGYSDAEIMSEVKEAIAEKPEASESPAEAENGDDKAGMVSDLEKMKRDYFKPKPPVSRNGTGVFIAAMSQKQGPKMESKPSMSKQGKMK